MAFSGFQSNAFQNNGFQIISSGAKDTHDLPIDHETYKRYRKKLEHVAKLAEKHHQSKYIKQAIKVAEIIEDTPIDAPIIKKTAELALSNKEIKIDFEMLAIEISKSLQYFDSVLAKRITDVEADDDMLMLLMMQ